MSELGMALLMKSEPAALLTDFEADATRHPSAAPVKEALQREAADVVAHSPLAPKSLGCAEFASLYEAQTTSSRPRPAAGDADTRTSDSFGSSDAPRSQQTGAGHPGTIAPEFAAYGLTPQTARTDAREERRYERERRRREPEQREEIEPQEKPGYTIDDIVQFAGITVAERHTRPADLDNTDRPKHH